MFLSLDSNDLGALSFMRADTVFRAVQVEMVRAKTVCRRFAMGFRGIKAIGSRESHT
jgi:hypothetical protein